MSRLPALILCVCLWAASAVAEQPSGQPQRRGGLLPDRAGDSLGTTAPAQTRDELARRWDINADGRIDEAEAELARAKMRRERNELMRRTEIDPLTGRPRGAPPPEPPAEPPPAADVFPADAPPTFDPRADAASGGRSGTARSPDGKPATAADAPLPPKRDLNAGRLPAGLPAARGTSPYRRSEPPRAAPQLPQRQSGAILLPPGAGMRAPRPTAVPPAAGGRTGVPVRPAPASPTRPRITAEEMGGP